MSTETVIVGCRLPQGYVLEVGLQTTTKLPNGQHTPMLKKLAGYQRFEIVGTNANYRRTRLRLPAAMNVEPHMNRVPKDLWDQWNKEHPRAWVVESGNLFVVPDVAGIEAAKLDAMSGPTPFNPMDPSKKIKMGTDQVETAKFDQD